MPYQQMLGGGGEETAPAKSGEKTTVQMCSEVAVWPLVEFDRQYSDNERSRPYPGTWFYMFHRETGESATLLAEVQVSPESQVVWFVQRLEQPLPLDQREEADRKKEPERLFVDASRIRKGHELGFFYHHRQLPEKALRNLLDDASRIHWADTDQPLDDEEETREGRDYRRLVFSTPDPYAELSTIELGPLGGRDLDMLLCVIRGYSGYDPQTSNVVVPRFATGAGLQKTVNGLKTYPNVGILPMLSSSTNSTKERLEEVTNTLYKHHPKSEVVMVGHSMGADNIIQFAQQNTDSDLDLIITLDRMDKEIIDELAWGDNDVPGNVKQFINYYQDREVPHGPALDKADPKKTRGVNIVASGSLHTSIDNDLQDIVAQDVVNFVKERDAIDRASQREIQKATPTDSTIVGGALGNASTAASDTSRSAPENE
jgi:hypothetical protein